MTAIEEKPDAKRFERHLSALNMRVGVMDSTAMAILWTMTCPSASSICGRRLETLGGGTSPLGPSRLLFEYFGAPAPSTYQRRRYSTLSPFHLSPTGVDFSHRPNTSVNFPDPVKYWLT